MMIDVDAIVDPAIKKTIWSRKVFQEFIYKNTKEKRINLPNYYSKEVWEVEKLSDSDNTDNTAQALEKKNRLKHVNSIIETKVNMVKLCSIVDYLEIILPLILKKP